MSQSTCSVDGCGRSDRIVRGWCISHYARWWRRTDVDGPLRGSAQTVCTVSGCERSGAIVRGMCRTHYNRSQRGTSLTAPVRPLYRDPTEALRARTVTDMSTGCVVWNGSASDGYGRINVGGKPTGAHRVAYERLVGPIPVGMHLDHLCRNPACVNPAHLEPVTQAENNRRAVQARKGPQ